jgi:hypothetical protein
MTKQEIILKLAKITGKTEYLENVQCEESAEEGLCGPDEHPNTEETLGSVREAERNKSNKTYESEELEAFKKAYKGSKIVKNKILGGRQMTRKEYLQLKRGLTYEEIWTHPLLYKMFRSEGQNESFFTRWVENFPRGE